MSYALVGFGVHGNPCIQPTDCAMNEACIDGRCKTMIPDPTVPLACETDGDCLPGGVCYGGLCLPADPALPEPSVPPPEPPSAPAAPAPSVPSPPPAAPAEPPTDDPEKAGIITAPIWLWGLVAVLGFGAIYLGEQ